MATVSAHAEPEPAEPAPLLEVRDLQVSFQLGQNTIYAVQGLSLHVDAGERVGVVGESGSGKSMTALSIMQMVPSPGRITDGEIFFDGQELLDLPESRLTHVRGRQIGMIPQNPLTSLNPVLTVEDHFQEVLSLHLGLSGAAAHTRIVELLRSVGIPDPATRMREYPHRLSGGQRQRVMIALAMACQPRLLIADEPTTALDVTIQAQILELFDDLVLNANLGAILITHNLGIVAGHCDRVVVMYAGRVMESGDGPRPVRPPRASLHARAAALRAPPHATSGRVRSTPSPACRPGDGARRQGARSPLGASGPATDAVTETPSVRGDPARPRHGLLAPGHGRSDGDDAAATSGAPANGSPAVPLLEVRTWSSTTTSGAQGQSSAATRPCTPSTGSASPSRARKTLGLVGESGCGKSTTGRTVLLLERPTSGTSASRAPTSGRSPRGIWRPCAATCRSFSRTRSAH